MKNLLLILFVCCFMLSCDSYEINPECDEGEARAIEDSKNGKYRIVHYGLPISDDWGFEEHYQRHMENEYGIEIGFGGCQVDENSDCYSNKMMEIVIGKFGDDIFKNGRKEAESTYVKDTSGFKSNIIDSIATFPGGMDRLYEYLNEHLSPKEFKGKCHVQFIVERDGALSEIEVHNSEDEDFSSHLLSGFKSMPKWNPGTKNGKPMSSRYSIPINVEKKNDRK